jgi:hypothetical protein
MDLEEAKRRYPPMIVIYDKPSDFPTVTVARLWYGPFATSTVIVGSLELIRDYCVGQGMVKLERHKDDQPHIVEVWI